MRQRLTLVFGFAALTLALVRGAFYVVSLPSFEAIPADSRRHFFIETSSALITTFALLVSGILLVVRSRIAVVALALTFVASSAHSVLVFSRLESIPEESNSAYVLGAIIGKALGLWLPPVLFLALIGYLLQAQKAGRQRV